MVNMRKLLIMQVLIWVGLSQTIFAQTSEDLNQLINLDSTVFRNYTASGSLLKPDSISVRTYGSIKYFTACLEGRIGVIPLSSMDIKKSKDLYKKYTDQNITYKRKNKSRFQLIVLLYDATGADLGETIWLNIGGDCKDSTDLMQGCGINRGSCNNVKALAKGNIFLIDIGQKQLLYSDEIRASGNNLENTIKFFTLTANNYFKYYAQNENDLKLTSYVREGKIVELKDLLSAQKPSINAISSNSGFTGLMIASELGNLEIAKLLLEKGAKVDLQSNSGWTALLYAANYGHLEIVKALLEKGAKIDLQDNDGWSALRCAAGEGHLEILKLLLEKGANVDSQTNNGWSALSSSSDKGNLEIVKLLLEKGAKVDLQSKYGVTALQCAAGKGHLEIVNLLLEKGARVDLQDTDGWTALYAASKNGHQEIVKLLLDKGANKDLTSTDGKTAFDVAKSESIRLLLSR
jgi:ankyrin repeat protein